jgi:hypothetical protein
VAIPVLGVVEHHWQRHDAECEHRGSEQQTRRP